MGTETESSSSRIGSAIALRLWDPLLVEPPRVDAVVIEAAYLARGPKKNVAVALSLARFGGIVLGAVHSRLTTARGAFHSPPAAEAAPTAWRSVLGLSGKDREESKARVLRGMPVLVPNLREVLAVLGETNDDVADAAGVALAGLRLRAWEDGFAGRLTSATQRPGRPSRAAGRALA
jgi:Holliday junction resolvasome RuvABC endonuclease subunit